MHCLGILGQRAWQSEMLSSMKNEFKGELENFNLREVYCKTSLGHDQRKNLELFTEGTSFMA